MIGKTLRSLTALTVALVAVVPLSGANAAGGGVFTTIDLLQSIDVNAPINPYNGKANEYVGYNLMQLGWAKNSLTDPNDLYPGMAKSWTLSSDGTKLTVNIQPQAKWSDGTPVTSKDIKTSVGLGISEGNNPIAVTILNDKSLVFVQPEGATSNTFVRSMLTIPLVPDSFWGAMIPASLWDNAATASDPKASADARAKASASIAALGKTLVSIGPKKDISSGPFTLKRVNPGEAILTTNPYFFDAAKIDPTTVVLKSFSGNQQIWSYLMSGRLDAAPYTSVPSNVLKSLLAVKGNATVLGLSQVGASLAFNQSVEPFNNVHVRRGLAYLIDRGIVTKIGEPTSGSVSVYTTGLIGPAAKLFMDVAVNHFNTYAVDKTKAADEFTQAGLTQQSGQWMLANGKPFTVNIQVPGGFSDWVVAGQAIATGLTADGINSQLETSPDYPTYLKDLAAGKFPVGFWLTSFGPGPYFAYQRIYGLANGWTTAGLNVTHAAAGTNKNWMGSPETQTLNGKIINPGELAASLNQLTGDAQKKVVAQLAELTNDQLPVIQIWDYINLQFINDNRYTNFPPANSDVLRNSPGVWMQLGYVKRK